MSADVRALGRRECGTWGVWVWVCVSYYIGTTLYIYLTRTPSPFPCAPARSHARIDRSITRIDRSITSRPRARRAMDRRRPWTKASRPRVNVEARDRRQSSTPPSVVSSFEPRARDVNQRRDASGRWNDACVRARPRDAVFASSPATRATEDATERRRRAYPSTSARTKAARADPARRRRGRREDGVRWVVNILFRLVLTSRGVVRVRAQIARPCVHARVAPRCVSDPARAMWDGRCGLS